MLEIAQAEGDRRGEGEALVDLALYHWSTFSWDHIPHAQRLAEEALRIAQETGDQRVAARSLTYLVAVDQVEGNLFKRAPFMPFRQTAVWHLTPNRLVLHLQPQEGISLCFGAKVPGPLVRLGPVNMEFRYADYFGTTPSTGYERLLYDGMTGDATLFQRADMVEAAWAVVAPILDVWKALTPRNFPNYAAGTWGPKAADELIGRDGRQWRGIE